MRNKFLLLAAASALTVAAAACSDDDTTEMSSDPPAPVTVDSDSTEPDSTEPESAPSTETSTETTSEPTSEPTGNIVTGSAGSWLPEHLDGLEVNESNAIPVIDLAVADDRVTPDHWVWD